MDRPCSNFFFFLCRASGCQVINVVVRSGSNRKNTSGSSSVFICMEELKLKYMKLLNKLPDGGITIIERKEDKRRKKKKS